MSEMSNLLQASDSETNHKNKNSKFLPQNPSSAIHHAHNLNIYHRNSGQVSAFNPNSKHHLEDLCSSENETIPKDMKTFDEYIDNDFEELFFNDCMKLFPEDGSKVGKRRLVKSILSLVTQHSINMMIKKLRTSQTFYVLIKTISSDKTCIKFSRLQY